MALAAVIGLAGIAMAVGKIGGRRLPLVAADLLKYRLVARLYAGSPAQLVRNEPPAPVESGPGPLSLMARRAGRGPRRVRVMARRGLRKAAKEPQTARRTDALPVRTAGSASAVRTLREITITSTGVGQPAMTGRRTPGEGSEAGS